MAVDLFNPAIAVRSLGLRSSVPIQRAINAIGQRGNGEASLAPLVRALRALMDPSISYRLSPRVLSPQVGTTWNVIQDEIRDGTRQREASI